jgi:hypothetical protein
MVLDIDNTVQAMIESARRAAAGEWRNIQKPLKRALDDERAYLRGLAEARAAGEVDDDMLAMQLREEDRALRAQLSLVAMAERAAVDRAMSAAMDAYRTAVSGVSAPAARLATAPVAGRGARRAAAAAPQKPLTAKDRRLNARPDTVDFRDLMYVPTLVEVGLTIPLDSYLKARVPILDQGQEGACTGFGLATVVHYLLRTRRVRPSDVVVSPRMLYAMAQRYDEWPGEAYEGSSCRGAMKGWHKHGVCTDGLWPHDPAVPDFSLDARRSADAQARPLGAYFRVNHKDLVAMHSAITEAGVLYASANVHSGWDGVGADGFIPFDDDVRPLGGHAFAVVAYDSEGFWIQNSWGPGWGWRGFGRITYQDWLKNGSDVWVARLGVPIEALARTASVSSGFTASSRARAYAADELRPHVISLGNDGELRRNGTLGTSPLGVSRIFGEDFPRVTEGWKKRRLVLYAHGGLVSEEAAVQRVSEYRLAMLEHECYPLAFVWHSDYWSTLKNILEDAVRHRRAEGVIDAAKDFMLDRLDDALEPLARMLTGKAAWDEMKENAVAATQSVTGGARLAADELARLAGKTDLEIHVVGHSAGSIFLGPLVQRLTAPQTAGGLGLTIESCTLWAPACTMSLFDAVYRPALEGGNIRRLALYTLTDRAEQDDHCARVYNKSLLYLVSNAFEARARIPLIRPEGVPLLGMARFVGTHAGLSTLIRQGKVMWIQAPNALPPGTPGASASVGHGGFDDDKATVASTLAFILGGGKGAAEAAHAAASAYDPKAGSSGIRAMRSGLERAR